MKAWQVDNMWEAAAAEEWERLNEPDPFAEQMKRAATWLAEAVDKLIEAENDIEQAAYELDGSPMEDRVESLLEELEGQRMSLARLGEKYERGDRD